jgi:hypothetical protein
VRVSARGRIGGASGRPRIRAGIVLPAGVDRVRAIIPAPDNHFAASPNRRVSVSVRGRVVAYVIPTIGLGVISCTWERKLTTVVIGTAAPDDHFNAGPDGCMKVSRKHATAGG